MHSRGWLPWLFLLQALSVKASFLQTVSHNNTLPCSSHSTSTCLHIPACFSTRWSDLSAVFTALALPCGCSSPHPTVSGQLCCTCFAFPAGACRRWQYVGFINKVAANLATNAASSTLTRMDTTLAAARRIPLHQEAPASVQSTATPIAIISAHQPTVQNRSPRGHSRASLPTQLGPAMP